MSDDGGEVAPALDARFVRNRAAVIVVCATTLIASFLWAPYVHSGPVVCPMRRLLGVPCPSCGMTRAFCALARLNVLEALRQNALGVPLFLLFIAAPLVSAYELRTRRRAGLYAFLFSHRIALAAGALVIVYHVARCGYMLCTGSLYADYLKTSWTYTLFR